MYSDWVKTLPTHELLGELWIIDMALTYTHIHSNGPFADQKPIAEAELSSRYEPPPEEVPEEVRTFLQEMQ
jgi:hypothetical protein